MGQWIRDIFRAGQANKGGIVRRSRASVRKNGGYSLLKRQVKRHGFHLVRTGEQYLILCHSGRMKLLV